MSHAQSVSPQKEHPDASHRAHRRRPGPGPRSPDRAAATTSPRRPAPTQDPKTIEITFEGDTVDPTGERVDVAVGQPIELVVKADEAGEIHVHSKPDEQELEYDEGTTTLDADDRQAGPGRRRVPRPRQGHRPARGRVGRPERHPRPRDRRLEGPPDPDRAGDRGRRRGPDDQLHGPRHRLAHAAVRRRDQRPPRAGAARPDRRLAGVRRRGPRSSASRSSRSRRWPPCSARTG